MLEFTLLDGLGLLLIFALATYIQTNTGFAFALVVISLGTALELIPLALLAFAVSGLSLVNSSTALSGAIRHIDRRIMGLLLLGCLPGAVFGVWLLDLLSDGYQGQLKVLFGVCIVGCGVLMMRRPQPLPQRSGNGVFASAGLLGGLTGGLFSAFGPPMAFTLYRQPLPVQTILNTLLATFWLTAILRIVVVLSLSTVDNRVFVLIAIGVPWIALCTWLAKRFPPPISEEALRRCAFGLLILSGASVLVAGLKAL